MNAFEKATFEFNARIAKRRAFADREWQANRHVYNCRRQFNRNIDRPFVVYYDDVCSGIGYESVLAARKAILQWCARNGQAKFNYSIRHFATQITVFEYNA